MAKRKRPKGPRPPRALSANQQRNRRSSRRAAARVQRDQVEALRLQAIREKAHRDQLTTLNSVNSPLLRLPAELRNMIFAHVYTGTVYKFREEPFETEGHDHEEFVMRNNRYYGERNRISSFFVCRQMHAETVRLPFELGFFEFECIDWGTDGIDGLSMLKRFLNKLTAKQIQALVDLKFSQWSGRLFADWYRNETAAYWVSVLDFIPASAHEDRSWWSYFDIRELGPSDA